MASGKLGSANLGAGVDALLFEATTTQSFNVRIVNRNALPVKVRIAIGQGVSPTAADYTCYDQTIAANGILEDTGQVASNGEKVWVRSNIDNVSVRAYGM